MFTLDHFGVLDELIQVIYQGVDRFVVLSGATDEAWIVSVGLEGPEGRWWQGRWEEDTVLRAVGHEAPERSIEMFAQQLAAHVVAGELYLTDWSSEKGASVKLTLGPMSDRPVHVALEELTAEAAAAMATTVFLRIALQAQSRGSQLHGSSGLIPQPAAEIQISSREKPPKTALTGGPSKKSADAEDGNSTLATSVPRKPRVQSELEAEGRKRKVEAVKPAQSSQPPGKSAKTAARAKGASLANPSKKARKYQAMEFGSDED